MTTPISSPSTPQRNVRIVILIGLAIGLLAVSSIWIFYLVTRKPLTDALPGAPLLDQSRPHYLFSIYGVDKPLGVASNSAGDRIYVTESGGDQRVKAFDRDGSLLFPLLAPAASGMQQAPIYVAVSPRNEVYVSDRQQRSILVFDQTGQHLRSIGEPGGLDGWAPLGLTFAGDRLLLTDVSEGRHRIVTADNSGNVSLAFGKEGKEPGQFWYPNGVEADKEGRIYVSDGNNGRVQVFDPQGSLLYKLTGLNLPRGTAVDNLGRLYVADAVGQRILVYNVNTQPMELLFEFGDLGFGDGEFNYPNDVAVDNSGRIYVADRENDRVQVWTY